MSLINFFMQICRSLACFVFFFFFSFGFSFVQGADIQRVVSPKGVEAWLLEEPSIPLISVFFAFDTGGSVSDPAERSGVAKMLASMLVEGAGDMDGLAFGTELENFAIDLSFNAGLDQFYGHMKTLTRNADKAFRLLALALNDPRFETKSLEDVRFSLLSDLKLSESVPFSRSLRLWFKNAFGDSPYGRWSGGTADTLSAISIADLRAARKRIFRRSQLKLGVVGDIAPERLKSYLDQVFSGLSSQEPDSNLFPIELKSGPWRAFSKMEIPQAVVIFGHAGISEKDPDYYAAHILNTIVGGNPFMSRLHKEIREKRGLTYSIETSMEQLKYSPLFFGVFSTMNERFDDAISLLRTELKDIARNGPTREEVRLAKNYLKGSYVVKLVGSDFLAEHLVDMQLYGRGINYMDNYVNFIDEVTHEQVVKVSARLLQPDQLMISIVGNPSGLQDDTPD
ncbi:MAG: pitrilysin family protein [Alphaproteobacteria bacterium]|nr:pitrilysin family protein [Alphaproteobacteria bacterium]